MTEKELREEAKDRAARAKSYAAKFPVEPTALMFQDEKWQYEQLLKFPRK